MTPTTPRRTWSTLPLALALAMSAACSNGDDAANPTADRTTAEKANLKAADLPSGWSSRPHEPLPGDENLRPNIARCLGITALAEGASADVRSPDFTQGLATVSSLITYVKTEADAKTHADALTSDRFAACAEPEYADQMHRTAPEGNTVMDLKISRRDVPALGDRSSGNRITATIQVNEQITVPITIEVIHIFKDRAEVELTVVAPGQPFADDFGPRLATAIADRL